MSKVSRTQSPLQGTVILSVSSYCHSTTSLYNVTLHYHRVGLLLFQSIPRIKYFSLWLSYLDPNDDVCERGRAISEMATVAHYTFSVL